MPTALGALQQGAAASPLVRVEQGQLEARLEPAVGGRLEVVGGVGSTGYSTGSHLHFEVRLTSGTTDPVPWLRQRGIRIGVAS